MHSVASAAAAGASWGGAAGAFARGGRRAAATHNASSATAATMASSLVPLPLSLWTASAVVSGMPSLSSGSGYESGRGVRSCGVVREGHASAPTQTPPLPIRTRGPLHGSSGAWALSTAPRLGPIPPPSTARTCFSTIAVEAAADGDLTNFNDPPPICTTDALGAERLSFGGGELPPLPIDEYSPESCVQDIFRAAKWNQGAEPTAAAVDDEEDEGQVRGPRRGKWGERSKASKRDWDPAFVRSAVDNYERHLRFILRRLEKSSFGGGGGVGGDDAGDTADLLSLVHPDPSFVASTSRLLSTTVTGRALKALTRTRLYTPALSSRVRALEKLVGSIGLTPLTNALSLRLLEANGKAGNVGRALSLLSLRKARGYPPKPVEFIYAVESIRSAGLYLRENRNPFVVDAEQPKLDNPTRWLDAILVNMHQRGRQVNTELANRMLDCYASTGRTGRARHFFYRVVLTPIEEEGEGGSAGSADGRTSEERKRPYKVRLRMNAPPPFHKIPSEVGSRPIPFPSRRKNCDSAAASSGASSSSSSLSASFGDSSSSEGVRRRAGAGSAEVTAAIGQSDDHPTVLKSKLEWESDPAWSPPLAAAFAFADSLTHGACGHSPIALDLCSYNTLVKVCTYRGALHRAMKLVEDTMPARGLRPDSISYNTVLAGLARVGDVRGMRELLTDMTNRGIEVDAFTVEALVDGFLNVGDVSSAASLVQDLFNQHGVVPPITSHLKILEFALGNDLPYEAKRHVYFLQQLWKWTAPPASNFGEGEEWKRDRLIYRVERTRDDPRLGREALRGVFEYFGEELMDDDFF